MNLNSLKKIILQIKKFQRTGHHEKAVARAREVLASEPNDKNIRYNAAGFFIDSGRVLKDLETVDEGIALIEGLLDRKDDSKPEYLISLKYNLSNGYDARSNILRGKGNELGANEALNKAKALLQSILINKKLIRKDAVASVMVNYAKMLYQHGRIIEAIDWNYDCMKNYNSAISKANCGVQIKNILRVSGKHTAKNVHEAWKLLSSACELKDEILSDSGKESLEWFKAQLQELVGEMEDNFDGGLKTIKKYAAHRIKVHGRPHVEKWLESVRQDRLLLTLNQNPLNSVEECLDDLFLESFVSIGGQKGIERFRELAYILNTIKEDYVTARYLFYHSEEAKGELSQRGVITNYVNAFDDADFGVLIGIMKASFRVAADCLDKIAIFINRYFELGNSNEHVNINNIWYKNKDTKKREIHPSLSGLLDSNIFLRALRDLQGDWFLRKFPSPLKTVRDSATHREMVLYWRRPVNPKTTDIKWDSDDFRTQTLFLLRMVKAAIIYTVCALTIEEQRKSEEVETKGHVTFRVDPGISESLLQERKKG